MLASNQPTKIDEFEDVCSVKPQGGAIITLNNEGPRLAEFGPRGFKMLASALETEQRRWTHTHDGEQLIVICPSERE
jgi:hypothetical protein